MSLKTKLIPILASLGATATMVPCLSSCGLNLETHNMLKEYHNHVISHLPMTIYDDENEDLIAKTYLSEAKFMPSILKDDLLYSFAGFVQKSLTDNSFSYKFTKYYLYVQDFDIDLGDETTTPSINFSVIIDMAGELKDGGTPFEYGESQVDKFDLTYTFHFDKGFEFISVPDGPKKDEKDKWFRIDLPIQGVARWDDYVMTSIAVGEYTPVNSAEAKLINVEEKINFGTELASSAVFYNNLFYELIAKNYLFMNSHYFRNVTYVIEQE